MSVSFTRKVSDFFRRPTLLVDAGLGQKVVSLAMKKKFDKVKDELTPAAIGAIPIQYLAHTLTFIACDDGAPCLKIILNSEKAQDFDRIDVDKCGKEIVQGSELKAAAVLLGSPCAENISSEILEGLLICVHRKNASSLVKKILDLPEAKEISNQVITQIMLQSAVQGEIDMVLSILSCSNYTATPIDNGNVYYIFIKNGYEKLAADFREFIKTHEKLSFKFEDNFPSAVRTAVEMNDLGTLHHLVSCYESDLDLVKCDDADLSCELTSSLAAACQSPSEGGQPVTMVKEILNIFDFNILTPRDKLKLEVLFWENQLRIYNEALFNILVEGLQELVPDKSYNEGTSIRAHIKILNNKITELPRSTKKPKPEEIKV